MNKQIESINLSNAKKLCEAAIDLAEKKEISIAVTVVDVRGMNLCTMAMNDAPLVSPLLSRKKAITALYVECPTIELQRQGVEVANFGQDYCPFGGGIPIYNRRKIMGSKEIIGAIGISGIDTLRIHGMDSGEVDHNLADRIVDEWY